MAVKDRGRDDLDASVQALLAEHERLAALHLYNADLGEKRVATFVTLVSLEVGALLAAPQLGLDREATIELLMGLTGGTSILGALTYQRLIERRLRRTEYLRAINRIHAWFVRHDPGIEPYFTWPASDAAPSYLGSRGANELRDIVAVLNSLFLGILVGLAITFFLPTLTYWVPVLAGLIIAAVAFRGHEAYARRALLEAERQSRQYIRFPRKSEQVSSPQPEPAARPADGAGS